MARSPLRSPRRPFCFRFTTLLTIYFRIGANPLNVSALPATLVESELFGHKKGAFTGAVSDRQGWLELCPPFGTVLLDEIAEITQEVQVKLLRVLQARTFQRVGEMRTRQFRGKLVTATNRDLAADMQAGHVRPDFYYSIVPIRSKNFGATCAAPIRSVVIP